MLILTRAIGTDIIIADNIVVRVLSSNNNQVKLGFDAPKNIEIHRKEIYERIQET